MNTPAEPAAMSQPGMRTNFAYNVAGSLIPLAISFGTVPIYIQQVGVDRYGIIAIALLLLGYFGFLDFGLSRASANALSRLAHAPAAERSPVIVTAFYLNLGLGAVGGLVTFVAGQLLLKSVFKISPSLQAEALAAFPWIAAMLPIGMLSGVATGVLESRERFLLSNVLSSVGTALGQVIPLGVAILVSPTLPYVIPTMLITRVLMLAGTFAVALRLEWPVRALDFHLAWVKRLFGYGAWVSVSSLISPVLDGLDQMLIGAILGPAANTHYAVPMSLALRSQLVAISLARTLFPQLSRVSPDEARRLAMRACIGLAYCFGAVCGPAILVAHAFLTLWIGRDFAEIAGPVATILLAGAWMNGIAFIPYSLLQGQGRPDLTAKVHAAEVIPFLALLWFLMHAFGLTGAAWAWTVRVGADCVILLVLSRFSHAMLWKLAPAVLLMALSLVAATAVGSPALMIAGAVVVAVLFAGVSLLIEPSLRVVVSRLLGSLRRISG